MSALNTIDTLPKRAILTDSGPLYATLDRKDEHHARANAEALRLKNEGIAVILAAPILLEAFSLILRRLGVTGAHNWLANAYSRTPLLNATDQDYEQAGDRVRRYPDQAITLTDATLAELGIQTGFSVWTYDGHFDIMRVPVWR